MPKRQVLPSSPLRLAAETKASPDRVTRWFLAAVMLVGIAYAGFGWTPSSYGLVLKALEAPDAGPVAGSGRDIRSDEWNVETPYFQAAVNNRFRRINETSFYREDMRNYYALPLADWSLAFKPQLWAFFALPPAAAFSIYWAILMSGFLAGYHLLFRRLGVPAWLALAATLLVYFSGFTQFWWTTYAPLLAGLPWILIIVLSSVSWWRKTLLCIWAFPALVLSHAYPTLLVTLAWGSLVIILAFRPSLLRSRGDIAAIVAGVFGAAVAVYVYYADVIPIMRNTIYPGHRVSPAGGTPVFAVLSQIFPSFDFRTSDYQNLTGENICEIGTVGSFLPLLTLCLMRYRTLRDQSGVRRALLILLAGFTAFTLWELAPVPAWIGHILLWNTGSTNRWLFITGLLLTLASLLIWSNRLISLHPFRITLFVLVGPVAAILLKVAWLTDAYHSAAAGFAKSPDELLICGLLVVAGLASWYIPAAARAPVLVAAIALVNVYAFGRFNPVQPAGPIFQVPDTALIRGLRKEAADSPDGVVVDPRIRGTILNGLGFRSVSQTLLAPQLAVFRRYFPNMDPDKFNSIFNRYAHVSLTREPMPEAPVRDVIGVPVEVFVPARNVRRLAFGPVQSHACSQPAAGEISRVTPQQNQLTIEGWAPWPAERSAQGIRVLSARPLHAGTLSTVTRPDLAEKLQDYRFVKCGFKLQFSSADGKPLRPQEVVLVAFGTPRGEVRLAGCGCP